MTLNSHLEQEPHGVSSNLIQLSVSKVQSVLNIAKPAAEQILRGYFAKYEKRYQGIFVASAIFDGKLVTTLVTNKQLSEGTIKGKIISLYLLAVRPIALENEPLDYSKFGFVDLKDADSPDFKKTSKLLPLATSDAANAALKRSGSSLGHDLDDGKAHQKVKPNEDTNDNKSKVSSTNTSNHALNNKISAENVKPKPSGNLMNFFGKK